MLNFLILLLLNAKVLTLELSLKEVDSSTVDVDIPNGKLLGKVHKYYTSFESIPYAEPPTGEHRFESPKPYLQKWEGVRDGSMRHHEKCLQFSEWAAINVDGDENCLFLNVYTPSLEAGKVYPTVFFIHGGSFVGGADNSFGEEIIMKHQNLVLVTFNYRLGALGFLSTQDDQISGNMGLKDQRLALLWVKENIAKFNGDPNRILLAGWSAGGASVHYHLLHVETEKLINAAASFSGTALCPWAFDRNSYQKSQVLARQMNCPTDDTKALKVCLKNKPAKAILQASRIFLNFPINAFPIKTFTPVVESPLVLDRFLDDVPETKIRNKSIANVPWLISHTAEESGAFSAVLLNISDPNTGESNMRLFSDKFHEFLPVLLFFDDDTNMTSNARKSKIDDLKKEFHLPDNITETDYCTVQEMFSSEQIAKGVENSARLHRENGKAPIFMYIYDNPPKYNIGNVLSLRADRKFGSVHGNDMSLIFKYRHFDDCAFDKYDQNISDHLIGMIKHLAENGTAKYGNVLLPDNQASDTNTLNYLNITKESVSVQSKEIKTN